MNTAILLSEAESVLRSNPRRSIEIFEMLSSNGVLSPSDSARLKLVASRAHLHIGQFAAGETIAHQAVEVCKGHSLLRELGLAFMELGIYRFVNTDFDAALNYYQQAERLISEAGKRNDLARVYINVANVYNRQAEYHNAISLYDKALSIAREVSDELTQAKVLTNISGLYQYILHDPESSVQYTELAAELYAKLNDTIGVAKCLFNKASYLTQLGKVEEALPLFRQALESRLNFSEPDELAMTFHGIIRCLLALGNIDEAQTILEHDFFTFQKTSPVPTTEIYYKFSQAQVLYALKDYNRAYEIATNVEQYFANNAIDELAVNLTELKGYILYDAGRFEEAASTLKELHDAKTQFTRSKAETKLIFLKGKLDISLVQAETELERLKNVELAQMVKHLEELHRENDEYVALLAHELRSPLHTMRAVCGLIAHNKNLSSEELISLEHEMHVVVTRMLDMITQVLDRTKQRHASYDGIVNAHTIWEHILNVTSFSAAQKQISVRWEFESTGLYVKASERDLITIIDNLVSNSVKYSPPGSRVDIVARIAQDDVHRKVIELSVKDNGPGFSEDDLKRLFRPYETLTARPTADEQSSGIGLHLVKRAVDRSGGQIRCESVLANGAVFIVRLPLSEQQ